MFFPLEWELLGYILLTTFKYFFKYIWEELLPWERKYSNFQMLKLKIIHVGT